MTLNCDIETGVCSLTPLEQTEINQPDAQSTIEVIYIGDPMCSWCWGISKNLKEIQNYSNQKQIGFSVIAGGLRPNGGDVWNETFKRFLRKEWAHIQNVTHQPFSFKLLERAEFDYNTEPACRAIVTARELFKTQDRNDFKLLAFFSAIQYKFYVDGEDPAQVDFYKDLCQQSQIDFKAFSELFSSQELKRETFEEFQLNRSWGVVGFPSIALRVGDTVKILASGHLQSEDIMHKIDTAISEYTLQNS